MVKNAGDYAEDGGWAYGAWATTELTPPAAADFDQGCVDCHTSSVGADNDFVFTRPGALPAGLFAPAGATPQSL
jgi:formate-dependent nitrite reductase cytochrome c552 subunit